MDSSTFIREEEIQNNVKKFVPYCEEHTYDIGGYRYTIRQYPSGKREIAFVSQS